MQAHVSKDLARFTTCRMEDKNILDETICRRLTSILIFPEPDSGPRSGNVGQGEMSQVQVANPMAFLSKRCYPMKFQSSRILTMEQFQGACMVLLL